MRAALSFAAAALLAAGAAQAQHQGHGQHDGHEPMDHAAMGHGAAQDHAGHAATAAVDPPVGPAARSAGSRPAHAADATYGAEAMARARARMLREHGDMTIARLVVDRLELRSVEGAEGVAWDADLSVGTDIDKLWIKTEGEATFGDQPEHLEAQALWSHALDPWFDLQAGVRQDILLGSDRTHAVIGLRGLLPYWIEFDGALFLSHKGDLTARLEAEHDVRITPRLIAQLRAEIDLSAQAVPALARGSGVTDTALGIRLRHEFTPRLAPYVGLEWEQAHGGTARRLRADGDDAGAVALVAGMRLRF